MATNSVSYADILNEAEKCYKSYPNLVNLNALVGTKAKRWERQFSQVAVRQRPHDLDLVQETKAYLSLKKAQETALSTMEILGKFLIAYQEAPVCEAQNKLLVQRYHDGFQKLSGEMWWALTAAAQKLDALIKADRFGVNEWSITGTLKWCVGATPNLDILIKEYFNSR